MQALVFHASEDLRLEHVREPQPGPGEVLVRVKACGICGSDVHGYLGHSARRSASAPLIMGHEFSGRVVERGPGVSGGIAEGTRVIVQPQSSCGRCRACRAGLTNVCPNMSIIGIERAGGFADIVAVPADRAFPVPAALDDLAATQVEPLAVGLHLFRQLAPPYPRSVVVLGAGTQGLLAVQLARLAGASEVIASDMLPRRLALAEQLGATSIVQADREDVIQRALACTDGWGAELVIDAVGAPAVRRQGLACLAPGGTLGLIGLGAGETELNFLPVVNKELRICGSYCYSDDDFLRALELLASGQIQVREMLQPALLSEGPDYFARLAHRPGDLLKVLLSPDE